MAIPVQEESTSVEVEVLDQSINRIILAGSSFLGKVRQYGPGAAATPAEAHLVEAIHNHPDANANQLAERLGFTKGNISLRTAKLCAKGLIEKYNRDHSRKEVFYRLTARGRALYEAHARFHEARNRSVYRKFRSFSQEQKEFLCMFLKEYAEHLESYYSGR
jgi:DNA-binding MarR family transcriptional regulator